LFAGAGRRHVVALSADRKTDLIMMAADILSRARADRVIREIGATSDAATFKTRNVEENSFLQELLAGTIVHAQIDSRTGNLCVTPR
jgi:hypothetical protein